MIRKPMRLWVTTFGVFALLLQCATAGETYKQDGQGLAKEFEGFLKAYHKGDDQRMDAEFAIFRIPNAKEWFASHFSAEDAPRLSAKYGQQMTDAQTSLIQDMNLAGTGNKYSLHCELRGDVAEKSDATQPVKPVRVEQFVLEFQAYSTREKFLFMGNFVYVDGAYRFVGGGGGPFWSKM